MRDGELFWRDEGVGEEVLLVHGGLMDPMDGDRFWGRPGVVGDLVGAGYRAIVPDRRFGGGRTRSDFVVATWEREVEDMLAVLDASGVERAHVVAGSNGCTVAARLALAAPGRVRSLALCWPGEPDNDELAELFEAGAALVERDGTAGYLALLRAAGLPRPGSASRPAFAFGVGLLSDERLASSFLSTPAGEAARVIRASAAALLVDGVIRGVTAEDAGRLVRLGVPIAVMPGDDRWHPPAVAVRLAQAISGATLLPSVPVAPSPVFAEHRAAFAAALVGWFEPVA